MAKKEHLDLIRQGVHVWNKRKANHPEEKPDFSDANLSFSNLSYANFRQANFWEANLNKAKLWGVNFSGADLCFADMSGTSLSRSNLRGANLTNADLSGADLRKADLRNTKLWGTNLSRANLRGANLSRADLTEADLSHANLEFTNCRGADLSDAELHHAKLSHTDLSYADLTRADLTEAVIEWSTFGNADLSTLKGLDTVRHNGPSVIGIDTTYRSGGNISDTFLRGTGIPENFIYYMALLAGQPVRFYSCFISHTPGDREFADQLRSDLCKKGIRCWLTEYQTNNTYQPEPFRIPYTAILPVFSKETVTNELTPKEIKAALEEERRRKKIMLFPILLDSVAVQKYKPVLSKNSARPEQENESRNISHSRYIADFSGWKEPEQYKAALNRLITEISDSFPEEKHPHKKKKPPRPSEKKSPEGNVGTVFFRESVYKIIGENECPLRYKIGDQLKLSGKSVIFPKEKAVCLILIQDIADVHAKYENTGGSAGTYSFRCSGCSGTIRIKYKELISAKLGKDLEERADQEHLGKTEEDIEALTDMLKEFSMFQNLEKEDVRYLVSFLGFRQYSADQIIIRKGEPGRNLFIIVSGKIEVLGQGGLSIAIMGRGEIFGEMSLLSGNPVGATIRTTEPVTVLYLSAKDFRKILLRLPSLQMYFTRLLAQRVVEIHDVRSEEFASGMVGRLSEMPPAELLQTLNINQKTGVLSLKLSGGSASIAFREGNLVRAEYNGKEGKEAFYEILGEKEGRFKFTPGLSSEDTEAEEIDDFMWLLMEGTRKLDEESEGA